MKRLVRIRVRLGVTLVHVLDESDSENIDGNGVGTRRLERGASQRRFKIEVIT